MSGIWSHGNYEIKIGSDVSTLCLYDLIIIFIIFIIVIVTTIIIILCCVFIINAASFSDWPNWQQSANLLTGGATTGP